MTGYDLIGKIDELCDDLVRETRIYFGMDKRKWHSAKLTLGRRTVEASNSDDIFEFVLDVLSGEANRAWAGAGFRQTGWQEFQANVHGDAVVFTLFTEFEQVME